MRKAIIGGLVCLIGAVIAFAGERAANSYKATKISTTSVLVSCQDEREPVIAHLDNTTAIVVTCKEVK